MIRTAAEQAQSRRADSRKSLKRVSAAGFTLIEVLVAMVVAVAALGVIAQGLTTGARASTISQNATRAAMLAQRIMTDLETAEIALDSSEGKAFSDEPDFAYETRSEPDEAGLSFVTVTIKWREREQDRTFVLTRLMRDKTATTTTNP